MVGRCSTILSFALLAVVVHASPLRAALFSPAAPKTLRQEMDLATVVVIAQSLSQDSGAKGSGEFEVVQVIKGEFLTMRPLVVRARRHPSAAGQQFLLIATGTSELRWQVVSPVTSVSSEFVDYLKQLSELPDHDIRQLEFFVRRLGDPDKQIAADAFAEVQAAPYGHLAQVRDIMDRRKLLAWIGNPESSAAQRSLYFQMLGIRGAVEDVALLESCMKAAKADPKTSAGLDEAIGAYLKLRGPAGLRTVEDLFLKDKSAAIQPVYSAIMALRYHLDRHDVIPRERVLMSMRLVLERPELADLVVGDFCRMEDWTVIEKLYTLFVEAETKEANWVRVPVLNYLRRCPLDKAKAYIAELKGIDPAAVSKSFKFFAIDS